MRRLIAPLLLAACLAPWPAALAPAAADELVEAEFSDRPCPLVLARIDRWIAALGEDLSTEERKRTRRRLLLAKRAAVPKLAAALDPTHAAIRALREKGEEPGPRLTQLMDLLEILGETRSRQAIAPLMTAATNAAWVGTLRARALASVGRIGDPAALAKLEPLLEDSTVATPAAEAILAIERYEAVPLWIRLLDYPTKSVATRAHRQLVEWTGERNSASTRTVWERYLRDYPEGFARMPGYVEE